MFRKCCVCYTRRLTQDPVVVFFFHLAVIQRVCYSLALTSHQRWLFHWIFFCLVYFFVFQMPVLNVIDFIFNAFGLFSADIQTYTRKLKRILANTKKNTKKKERTRWDKYITHTDFHSLARVTLFKLRQCPQSNSTHWRTMPIHIKKKNVKKKQGLCSLVNYTIAIKVVPRLSWRNHNTGCCTNISSVRGPKPLH